MSMRLAELQVLLTSLQEHIARKMITDALNVADSTEVELDQGTFRSLNDFWLKTRDAQRLAQTGYAALSTQEWKDNPKGAGNGGLAELRPVHRGQAEAIVAKVLKDHLLAPKPGGLLCSCKLLVSPVSFDAFIAHQSRATMSALNTWITA